MSSPPDFRFLFVIMKIVQAEAEVKVIFDLFSPS